MPALSKEALEKFARSYTGDDLPGALIDALVQAENIRDALNQLARGEEKIYADYARLHKAIEEDVKEIRRACKHLDVTTSSGDRSVGAEPVSRCNVCGLEFDSPTVSIGLEFNSVSIPSQDVHPLEQVPHGAKGL